MLVEYPKTSFSEELTVNGIFTVFSVEFENRPYTNGEAHNFPEIIYIKQGEHHLILNENEISLSAGQMMIYAPGSFHKISKKGSNAIASIISFDVSDKELPALYNEPITLNALQKNMLNEITEIGCKLFVRRKGGMVLRDGASHSDLLRFKKQLEFFLADLIRTQNVQKEKSIDQKKLKGWQKEFNMITEFLYQNISKNLTLDDIAKSGYMSVSKLKLVFREFANTGPLNYFNILKIEEAKKLIRAGKYNITQISDILGFNSLHYFSRFFKKTVGLTPTEYKKSTM